MEKDIVRLGLDIGSTTVKCAVLENGRAIYSYYERHFSDIQGAVRAMLKDAHSQLGDIPVRAYVTGSGGLSVGQWFNLPLRAGGHRGEPRRQAFHPRHRRRHRTGRRGRQESRIFSGSAEQRMNGTCAGRHGRVQSTRWQRCWKPTQRGWMRLLPKRSTSTRSRRAAAYSPKTDIQPLLNEGAAREDIAASVLQAVVNQTISGLACGQAHPRQGCVLGRPAAFSSGAQGALRQDA